MKKLITTEIQPSNKPIKTIKSYHITIIEYEDGSTSMHRENTGFISFELIGLIEFIKDEMIKMTFPKPDERTFSNITRTVKNCKVTQIKKKKI